MFTKGKGKAETAQFAWIKLTDLFKKHHEYDIAPILQPAKFPKLWLTYGSQVHTADTQLVTYLHIT